MSENVTELSGGMISDEHSSVPAVYKWDGSRMDTPEVEPDAYNFRNPGFLSQADLRQLAVTHEKYVQHLSARLSTFLRMECVIKIRKLNSSTFAKFCEGIQSPTHVTLFQVEPLRGVGILDMSLPLALAIADRLLGGKGRVIESDNNLTEMEVALVEDAVQLILTEWSNQWHDNNWNFQPHCIGTDTSGRFLQTSAAEAVTLMIDLEVTLGECIEHMQMGVPFSMIEVIVKKMQQSRLKGDETRAKQLEWRSPYEEIGVSVIADWVVKELTIQEVLDLSPGDMLPMSMELISNTRVRLSETPQFIGTVGIQNGRIAVELNSLITSE
jgi:flagellar motor switch protein FliM